MKTVKGYPPNIDQINDVLHTIGKRDIIYTYGDICYMPSGGTLTPDLEAHESTHTRQQAGDPEGWWDRYLTDEKFRLEQEVQAYRVQYNWFVEHGNRKQRRAMLQLFAKTLASPMYGNIVSVAEAKDLISR